VSHVFPTSASHTGFAADRRNTFQDEIAFIADALKNAKTSLPVLTGD